MSSSTATKPVKTSKPAAATSDRPTVTYPAGQVRILATLAKAPMGRMPGDKLQLKAKISSRAWLSEYLGTPESPDNGFLMRKGIRTSARKLVPAKLVKVIQDPELPGRVYEITAQGRKTLTKLQAEE